MTGPSTPPPRDQIQSPWTWEAGDYMDRKISIVVPWDRASGLVGPVAVHRDVDCLYTKIFIGTGADGTPDTAGRQFTVPVGDTTVTVNQLNKRGITTIEDVLGYQITAGAPTQSPRN